MLEFFIAKRYLRSKHKINFISIISIISTIGITIGVAALIIVLSVFNGFGSLVTSMMISFDPHIRITEKQVGSFDKSKNYEKELLAINGVKDVQVYNEGKVVLLYKGRDEIVNLKGINPAHIDENSGLAKNLLYGSYKIHSSSNNPSILIGLPLAFRLSCAVGDTLTLSSFENIERILSDFTFPKTQRYVVRGIFQTHNKEYDYGYVFSDINSTSEAFLNRKSISGIDLMLSDIDKADFTKRELLEIFPKDKFSIYTWFDLHKDLYIVMQIERWAAYIILCLIIAVATFNILGSLTMSVIEKKKDIGLLKSIGMTRKSILRIFMFEGLLIGVIGTITGVIIGLIVCYLQLEYNFYTLDSAKYIIDTLPLKISIVDITATAGMSLFLSFLAALYPAKRAVKISIIDAIKWE